MSDLLEEDLRGALAERASLTTPEASARLRAVDYRPRSRSLTSWPALGGLGVTTAGVAAALAILLGSSAAPAFAGWTANPTAPQHGQLTAAQQDCGASSGSPVLTDTRGPYTASIYSDGSTCVEGNGITISSSGHGGSTSSIPAGTIDLNGAGESDSDGNALTMVYGQIGAGVIAATIARDDGTSVQATVQNGWYLAWWPGTERAVTAQVSECERDQHAILPDSPEQVGGSGVPGRCPLLNRLRLRVRPGAGWRAVDDAVERQQCRRAVGTGAPGGGRLPAPELWARVSARVW